MSRSQPRTLFSASLVSFFPLHHPGHLVLLQFGLQDTLPRKVLKNVQRCNSNKIGLFQVPGLVLTPKPAVCKCHGRLASTDCSSDLCLFINQFCRSGKNGLHQVLNSYSVKTCSVSVLWASSDCKILSFSSVNVTGYMEKVFFKPLTRTAA